MRLENWAVNSVGSVWGKVYEDVRGKWKDGHLIELSRALVQGTLPEEGKIYKTLNSEYLMGQPLNNS